VGNANPTLRCKEGGQISIMKEFINIAFS